MRKDGKKIDDTVDASGSFARISKQHDNVVSSGLSQGDNINVVGRRFEDSYSVAPGSQQMG